MTTEIVAYQANTSLALSEDQRGFTEQQIAALHHMGVENAGPADLEVFFHVAKRSGLDPFARQIHMIGRNTKDARTQQWVTKYTIQTGIDGYRLIGRRAADRARVSISLSQPEWAHEDGTWRPVWARTWGMPVAARVTIMRDGQPFTAVAIFDEYKQTKRDGGLTSMWAQRPAGQIAKCAEALAWRMAFPQDLSGIYTDDEMHQADSVPVEREPKRHGMDALRDAVAPTTEAPAEDVQEAVVVEEITKPQLAKIKAGLSDLDIGTAADKDLALALYEAAIGRPVTSTKDLTKAEASAVIEAIEARRAAMPTETEPSQQADPRAGEQA